MVMAKFECLFILVLSYAILVLFKDDAVRELIWEIFYFKVGKGLQQRSRQQWWIHRVRTIMKKRVFTQLQNSWQLHNVGITGKKEKWKYAAGNLKEFYVFKLIIIIIKGYLFTFSPFCFFLYLIHGRKK